MPKEKKVKEKKVKEKKIKAGKLKGKGEVGEEIQEGEGKAKGKGKLKLLILIVSVVLILAAAAIVVFVFVMPKLNTGEEPPPEESPEPEPVYYDLPESFEVGGVSVAAMEPLERNGVQAERDPRIMYTYTGLEDAGAEAEAYAATLRGAGFSIVDEEFVRASAPDYTTPEGEVLLAKDLPKEKVEAPAASEPDENGGGGENGGDAAPVSSAEPVEPVPPVEEEPDMVVTMRITWTPGQCVVLGDQEEGKVTSPPRNPNGTGGSSNLSLWDATEFIAGLEPSVLGLSGESMENYRVYAEDGVAMVDNQPCMRMKVYERNGNINSFAGTYLLTADGQHLYRLNEDTGTVQELKLP